MRRTPGATRSLSARWDRTRSRSVQWKPPARSSSGPGHCPLKAETTGSNPVRATARLTHASWRARHSLSQFGHEDALLAIDTLWDFDDPAASEHRFRERLASTAGDERLEVLTQLARAQGLQDR